MSRDYKIVRWTFFFVVFLACFCTVPVHALENKYIVPDWLSFSGWMDTMHSVRSRSPHDKVTSRIRLRLEAKADFEWFYAFCSVDAEKNWIISSETGVDVQECWLEHISDRWDVRMGHQIIIWGQADGVQITDMISPPDLTESITRDLDEIRMPVNAVRLRFLGDFLTTEFICIPVFKSAVYPKDDNPWSFPVMNPPGINISLLPAEEPDTSLENVEIAAKVSAYLSGIDVAGSIFYTWDDTPALHPVFSIPGNFSDIRITPRHHRLTIIGLEFSRPWSDFVFRGETAFYKGRYLARNFFAREPLSKNLIKWLAGVDWSPGNDWSITAQIVGESIFGYQDDLAARKNSCLATVNISKKLMNQRLSISNMIYADFDNHGFYDRIKSDYEVLDGLHLLIGLDFFNGREGSFALYEDNSQFWIKVKYNF